MAAAMINAVTDIDKPAFVLRLDQPELVEANAAARDLWGIGPQADLPLAIDADMPALRDIRAVSEQWPPSNGQSSPREFHDQLVFWTWRGAQRLASRYQVFEDSARVTVIIEELAATRSNDAATTGDSDPAACDAETTRAPATALDLRTMAHELRTPIGAVIALADMIDQEPFGTLGDPRYREYARDIRDSAHLALNIVAAALERNEGEEEILFGGIHEIDVAPLLEKARRALRLNARSAGLAIDIEISPQIPCLLANPPGLNQILLNLIANAIKFTPPGGHITISARETSSGGLEICVTDTGIGMTEYETSVLVESAPPPAADSRPASAQPDQQPPDGADEIISGSPALDARSTDNDANAPPVPAAPQRHRGIGFTLVRRLAAAMGATLTVSSQRGVGTRVSVAFPAANVLPRQRPSEGG